MSVAAEFPELTVFQMIIWFGVSFKPSSKEYYDNKQTYLLRWQLQLAALMSQIQSSMTSHSSFIHSPSCINKQLFPKSLIDNWSFGPLVYPQKLSNILEKVHCIYGQKSSKPRMSYSLKATYFISLGFSPNLENSCSKMMFDTVKPPNWNPTVQSIFSRMFVLFLEISHNFLDKLVLVSE